MKVARRAAVLLGLAAVIAPVACVILPPDPAPPTPIPIPFPGGDQKGLGVLWMIRIDRSAANLAHEYEGLVNEFALTLSQAGFIVGNEAVGILYDDFPELIWGRRQGVPEQFPLSEVIRFHAARAPDAAPNVCTTNALMRAGIDLPNLVVNYPEDLVDAGEPIEDAGEPGDGGEPLDAGGSSDAGGEAPDGGQAGPLRPFEGAPSAFVAVMVDAAARPFPHGSGPCLIGSQRPAVWFDAYDPAEWAHFGTQKLPRLHTRLVIVATAEEETPSEMRQRCASIPGFPKNTLDVIAPSPEPFFKHMSNEMSPAMTGRTLTHATFDFCEAAAGTWNVRGFVYGWVAEIKQSMGLQP